MPLLKLFDSGALVPAPIDYSQAPAAELEKRLLSSLSNPTQTIGSRLEIQSILIEASKRINVAATNLQNMGSILYPNLKFKRTSLPCELPEISPAQALQALAHLPQAALPQHPAFQIIPLRTISDFKIASFKLAQGHGPFSELIFYHGADAVLRLHGPTIFILAAKDQLQNKLGKTWSETKQKLFFPLDVSVVVSQIKQMDSMLKTELDSANFYGKLIDSSVCTLAGFCTVQESYEITNRIKTYLQPTVSAVVTSTDSSLLMPPANSVGTINILQ